MRNQPAESLFGDYSIFGEGLSEDDLVVSLVDQAAPAIIKSVLADLFKEGVLGHTGDFPIKLFIKDKYAAFDAESDSQKAKERNDYYRKRLRFLGNLVLYEHAINRRFNDAFETANDNLTEGSNATTIEEVKSIITDLDDLGFIEASIPVGGKDGPINVQLTDLGYEYWQMSSQDAENQKTVPAASRVVSLDHNSQAYKEAIQAIDVVSEAIRGDNEYGNRDPEDKEQRLAELLAGRKLLEAGRASVNAVNTVLMKTLLYLAGIGVAVTQVATAIEAVQKLLK